MPVNDLHEADRPATHRSPDESAPSRQRRRWTAPVISLALLAALGAAIYVGIADRMQAEKDLARVTDASAIPTVEVIHPKPGAPEIPLLLPGNMQAISDTAIYARANGYVKHWYFDIGAHVKRGELMAEIDTPEIDDQLRQARADLVNAQASRDLAAITAQRKERLLKTGAAPIQDRDNAVSALSVASAVVQAKTAAVAQLENMQSFGRVEAPFDGVVTARSVDVGALITAGSAGSARELFHLVAIDWLRIYVSIPEPYSPAMRIGTAAKVTLDEFPGETFAGTLVRTANAIDPASRTLLVEVDVPNKDGKLLPGSYAHVLFSIPSAQSSVTVPANTLLFRKEGLQAGVVRNGIVDLVPVKIGHDFGDTVEIISGLQASDEIVANPADSLLSGARVMVRKTEEAPAAK